MESKSVDSVSFLTLIQLFSWKTRLRTISRATRQHALNLAKFVSLYKTLLLLQKKMNGGLQRSADTFIAGLIGGYFVFGDRNAVNEQVRCLLLFASRELSVR